MPAGDAKARTAGRSCMRSAAAQMWAQMRARTVAPFAKPHVVPRQLFLLRALSTRNSYVPLRREPHHGTALSHRWAQMDAKSSEPSRARGAARVVEHVELAHLIAAAEAELGRPVAARVVEAVCAVLLARRERVPPPEK